MKINERIAIAVSVVAIIVSVVTAYFQFRQEDELRVVTFMMDTPAMIQTEEGISLQSSWQFSFSNTGNRPALIQGISWLIAHTEGTDPGREELERCWTSPGGVISEPWQPRMAPFVAEPGKIHTVVVDFPPVTPQFTSGGYAGHFVTCFKFVVIDADGRSYCPSVPALWFDGGGGSGSGDAFYQLLPSPPCQG